MKKIAGIVLGLVAFGVIIFLSRDTSIAPTVSDVIANNPVVETVKDIFVEPEKPARILNFGDAMFDRGVRDIMEDRGRDPFEYIKRDIGVVSGFDIVLLNLEGPIVEMPRENCQQKSYNFQFDDTTPTLLKSIGVNMVTIGNNHAYDCYQAGVDSTKNFLEKAGIEYIGDKPFEKSFIEKTINAKKVAFVGVDVTMQPITAEFYKLVQELDTRNDYLVVNIHWGDEYELVENETQTAIAHALVDSGADVVVGHHPHVMQPMRMYKNKPVFFSLGNFVFDQFALNTTDGYGVGMELYSDKMIFEILPYKLNKFAPEFIYNENKEKVCKFVGVSNCKLEVQI
ncbi:MAG: CapA family protein [Patescibacteria group bacterium]